MESIKQYVNVADLVLSSRKTWREENLEKPHNIPIGALVELQSGIRLFVGSHARDCDGTPLYWLTPVKGETANLSGKWMGGYSESCLTIIPEH